MDQFYSKNCEYKKKHDIIINCNYVVDDPNRKKS